MIRYLCALIWTGLLACFSYGDLILNFFNKNGISFEDKILETHASSLMILVNVGLVVMLYIDKLITHFVTGKSNKNQYTDVILIINIVLAVAITVIAQLMINKSDSFVPVDWFKLSYLFALFALLLVVYKAETLKIKHTSSINDIINENN